MGGLFNRGLAPGSTIADRQFAAPQNKPLPPFTISPKMGLEIESSVQWRTEDFHYANRRQDIGNAAIDHPAGAG
jgi:hypothetical protein